MYDSPVNPNGSSSEYRIPEHFKKYIEECEPKMTVNELRACADYFNECARRLERDLHEEVTMEDFDKAHKDEEYTEEGEE